MKIYLLLLFTISFNIAFSQNYIEYNKLITKAENHILDSNYTEAIVNYTEAFKKFDFVFAKHCYTALQATSLSKDSTKAVFFLRKGIKQGLELDLLENAPLISNLSKNTWWNNFIATEYDSLHAIYLSKINVRLRDQLIKLATLDQLYTKKLNKYRFRIIPQIIAYRNWKTEIGKLVEIELLTMIEKYGFPGEKLVGINTNIRFEDTISNDLMISQLKKGIGGPESINAHLILIHYISGRKNKIDFHLLENLKNGNINAIQFASIQDFSMKCNSEIKIGYFNQWHRNPDTSAIVNDDINRISIGLEDFETLRRKEKRNWKIQKEISNNNVNHIKIWTVGGGY
jgi:hypothetical protein